MRLPDLVARAASLAEGPRRLLGIAGAPGAGSTLAAALVAALPGRLRAPHEDVVYAPLFRRAQEQAVAGALAVVVRRTG